MPSRGVLGRSPSPVIETEDKSTMTLDQANGDLVRVASVTSVTSANSLSHVEAQLESDRHEKAQYEQDLAKFERGESV